jgi:hypothetical protein
VPEGFSDKGKHQPNNGVFDNGSHVFQGGDDRQPAQFFSVSEAYREGRLEVRFLLDGFDGLSLVESDGKITDSAYLKAARKVADPVFPDQLTKLGDGELKGSPDRDDEMVLITLVENLDGVQIKLPARIGLEAMYLVDDLFGGEMHLSCRDGTTKTLTSALRKGEANARRVLCLVAHHPEAKMIERRSEVVDSIPQDKREMLWDGVLGLDVNHSPRGILGLRDSQLERVCLEVFGDLPVQVADVTFGPLDL